MPPIFATACVIEICEVISEALSFALPPTALGIGKSKTYQKADMTEGRANFQAVVRVERNINSEPRSIAMKKFTCDIAPDIGDIYIHGMTVHVATLETDTEAPMLNLGESLNGTDNVMPSSGALP
jgi:hypothetical protein